MITLAIIGFLSGIISGMGIGGGAILIPALVFFADIGQKEAQLINLFYFVPAAVAALFSHAKQGNIEKRVLKPLILIGVAAACAGAILAVKTEAETLRKMFGFFLLFMGGYEIYKGTKKTD